MTEPTYAEGTCPKCQRRLATDGELVWCEGCGWEAPESVARNPLTPAAVAKLEEQNRRDREMEHTNPGTMPTVAATAAEIATACKRRLQQLDRAIAELDGKRQEYQDERARLAKTVSFLEGTPAGKPSKAKSAPAGDGVFGCDEDNCGRSFATFGAVQIHKARIHGPGWDTTKNLQKKDDAA